MTTLPDESPDVQAARIRAAPPASENSRSRMAHSASLPVASMVPLPCLVQSQKEMTVRTLKFDQQGRSEAEFIMLVGLAAKDGRHKSNVLLDIRKWERMLGRSVTVAASAPTVAWFAR